MKAVISSIAVAIILALILSLPALAQESGTITITMTGVNDISISLDKTAWPLGNVTLNTEDKIREFFSSGRTLIEESPTADSKKKFRADSEEIFDLALTSTDLNNLIKANFGETLEESLINLIIKVSDPGIIVSKNLFIHGEQEKGLALIRSSGIEQTIQTPDIRDIKESKEQLTAEINQLEVPQSEKNILIKPFSSLKP